MICNQGSAAVSERDKQFSTKSKQHYVFSLLEGIRWCSGHHLTHQTMTRMTKYNTPTQKTISITIQTCCHLTKIEVLQDDKHPENLYGKSKIIMTTFPTR
jgi:hypothetical protein